MNKLEALFAEQPYVLLDGAMGTMLMDAGLESGAPPEEWNVLHPEAVQAVHRSYIDAGSSVILTNSFGGTRYRLKMHNLQESVFELNRAAAVNARAAADAAPGSVVVGGSIGPSGELMSPLGTMTFDEAKEAFAEQAAGLVEGGADLIWIETMSDLNELIAAVEGARCAGDLPVVATMTFDTNGHTMMGISPASAVHALGQLNLFALGGNCGNGPQEIESVIGAMRRASQESILVAKSNAGVPIWMDDDLVFDGTPEVMASYAVRVRAVGARLIGACCGSTPDHIRAMAAALDGSSAVADAPIVVDGDVGIDAQRARAVRERRFKRRPRRSS
jgi:5-methyltetrahydrofolate--homocysteine methyltransferase